jgi:hypothetical protein
MKTFAQFLKEANNPFGLRSKADILQSDRLKNAQERQQQDLKNQAIGRRQRQLSQQRNRFTQTDSANEQQSQSAAVQARKRRNTFNSL